MPVLLRCLKVASLGGLFMAAGAAEEPGRAVTSAATVDSTIAELQAELAALQARVWHPSASVAGSLGWRDNVLLSPFAPIARWFGRAEVETMLMRPRRNRWEFVALLTGDVLRYFAAPPETGGEQQWLLHAEGRWHPLAPLRLSLRAAGDWQDMVIDLSETEARRVVASTRVRGGHVGTAVRLALPLGLRLEPVAQLKRNDYRDYNGDYDEGRWGGRLEWRRTALLALAVAWTETSRNYDQRTEYTAGGRALTGTRLRLRQSDGVVQAKAGWRTGGEWRLVVEAGRRQNRDEASGYFNYDQHRGSLELEWTRGPWRLRMEAEGRRVSYQVQTVGAGLAPPARRAEEYETAGRVERQLSAGWEAFAEHRWERSRSNEAEFSYRANTVLAGVRRSF